MNKQKKLKQIHQKRLKTAKAKRNPSKKAPYISKAERQKLENEALADNSSSQE